MAIEFSASDEQVDATTQVVSVRGEIDLFTAPEFKGLIHEAIEAGRDLVVVDLTGTTFIDSSSLGVLIGAHRRLASRDRTLVIVASNRNVLKTLRITGLDSLFRVVQTLDEAAEASAATA